MPGDFAVVVETPLTPAQAWARVWDLDRHTSVIPLTTVATIPPGQPLGVGVTFCGRTGLGPVGFDDPMRCIEWEPPVADRGRATVVKTGGVIGGRIEVEFAPAAGHGTRITWRQQVELPWLPSPLVRLERPAARLVAPGYRSVLRRLLA